MHGPNTSLAGLLRQCYTPAYCFICFITCGLCAVQPCGGAHTVQLCSIGLVFFSTINGISRSGEPLFLCTAQSSMHCLFGCMAVIGCWFAVCMPCVWLNFTVMEDALLTYYFLDTILPKCAIAFVLCVVSGFLSVLYCHNYALFHCKYQVGWLAIGCL